MNMDEIEKTVEVFKALMRDELPTLYKHFGMICSKISNND
jgi:hypothetical protein